MAKQGIHIINSLRRRWVIYQVLADVALAAAIALAAAGLLHLVSVSTLCALPVFAVALVAVLALHRPWLIGNSNITGFLNQHYVELEESADLILPVFTR
jgi:choline-glycine betaine transporter